MSRTVNENSVAVFTVFPFDEEGSASTPTNARYRVDDKDTGGSVIAWTNVSTPSSEMTITIPSTSNTIIDGSKSEEVKVLTVETDYSTANAHVEEYEYTVRNLQFVS